MLNILEGDETLRHSFLPSFLPPSSLPYFISSFLLWAVLIVSSAVPAAGEGFPLNFSSMENAVFSSSWFCVVDFLIHIPLEIWV